MYQSDLIELTSIEEVGQFLGRLPPNVDSDALFHHISAISLSNKKFSQVLVQYKWNPLTPPSSNYLSFWYILYAESSLTRTVLIHVTCKQVCSVTCTMWMDWFVHNMYDGCLEHVLTAAAWLVMPHWLVSSVEVHRERSCAIHQEGLLLHLGCSLDLWC